MKVTYVNHSGFVVEFDDKILVFDYYRGELPKFDKSKSIYVFVSHGHEDHFNQEIFKWKSKFQKVVYILASEINDSSWDETISVFPNQEIKLSDEFIIRTLPSTDEGVAFLINVDKKTLFHAGDLHWWHWNGETDLFNQEMERDYKKYIEEVKGEHIDFAFIPLDPRQQNAYYWGMLYFLENMDVSYVFPMHMWGRYRIVTELLEKQEMQPYRDKIIRITRENESFNFN
ncbi:L-ascorbate metabolism protein UlaG (beta-lactamase superfamily) [Aequitasia blattaphilus]|uniref:MBL fold metallo-hydrolase n=1 Tax=Aequitasia blattaphilus TaxID=2949332 RepID=A0ABT1E6U1_9FIRM|nr:MBL fold metallo-hydrolase [Aequitasia blattaphilus]MCP1101547.1 MBL fold metallo-hydrolase [Aequitasia blattaphilus]MCR8614187.1 MBL fold metallo-hydrolase [Aequitasia blattaphilus]